MLEHFLIVFGQVVTLFLLVGVGFFLAKKELLSAETAGQMSFLLLYIVTPCVIVNCFETDWDAAMLGTLGKAVAVAVGSFVVYDLLSGLFFRRRDPDQGAPLRFGAVYANTGFMGLPLVLAVLGNDALIFAAIIMVTFNISSWTHGVVLMGGKQAFSPKKAILNPGVVGTVIGLPLFLLRLRLPGPIDGAVGYIAGLNTPLAMIVVGSQMARTNLGSTFRRVELYQASAVKLVLIPLLTALLLVPLHLDPLFYCTAVILSAAPSAGATAMFAERFGRDPAIAAQLVSLSTLLCVVTLPVMATLAQVLAG